MKRQQSSVNKKWRFFLFSDFFYSKRTSLFSRFMLEWRTVYCVTYCEYGHFWYRIFSCSAWIRVNTTMDMFQIRSGIFLHKDYIIYDVSISWFMREMNTIRNSVVYCQMLVSVYTKVILEIHRVYILVFMLFSYLFSYSCFPVFLCIRKYIFSNLVIISRILTYPMEKRF